jgi:hypothetical protein
LHDVRESYRSYEYREDFPAASDIRMQITGEFPGPTWDELSRDKKEMLLGRALGLNGRAFRLINGVAAQDAERMISAFLDAEEKPFAAEVIANPPRFEEKPKSAFDREIEGVANRGGTKDKDRGLER